MSLSALLPPFLPALLALADGTVFRGYAIGAEGSTERGGGVQHRHDRLSGNPDRPLVLPPDRHPDLPCTSATPVATTKTGSRAPITPPASSSATCRSCASNWRMTSTLPDYLKKNGIVAIAGIDTRALTRATREGRPGRLHHHRRRRCKGDCRGEGLPGLAGMDLAKVVSVDSPYEWRRRDGR